VSRRLGRQPNGKQRPAEIVVLTCCHDSDCSVGYFERREEWRSERSA
jgi:hypothetical protein